LESPGIRVQLCGRVAIDLGGRRVEHSLPSRQGRLLFVYLAIHRLRAVTRDELAEAVWPDGPPTAWDSALNALLSKLRRLLGDDLVPARGDPRLVLPTAAWVDLEAARDAVHRAESAVALEDWPRACSPRDAGSCLAMTSPGQRRSAASLPSCTCGRWRPTPLPPSGSAGRSWPPPSVQAASW
jgi:hypothetical protein